MTSKTLCALMRIAVIAVALCGIAIGTWVIPSLGSAIVAANPEFADWYFSWLVFAWAVGLPCFAVLLFVWKVALAIKQDTVFTLQTAKWIKAGSIIVFCDAGLFFIGNIALLLMNKNHMGILFVSLLADILALSFGLLAAVLSRYITKAAALQEVNDAMI
ncbi:MAG: DUF2975 domain-containing protein [Eubacteriaceae bacterium]|nr:DUF2975 domain-containing protein [Eubacteriaceae bacterium]